MPKVGVVASSVLPHTNMAAIWPGDSYPVDATMPAGATTNATKIAQLTRLGYMPDATLWLEPWPPGASMRYNDIAAYWSGTRWVVGTAPAIGSSNLAPRSVNSTANTVDISRLPKAKRVAALNRIYKPTASGGAAWATGNYASFGIHIIQWDGTSWVLISTTPEFTEHPVTSKLLTFRERSPS